MKKMAVLLAIVSLFLTIASPVMAAADSKHAGFTAEGVFYLSDEYVEKAGYGSPTLKADLTGWVDKEMTLNDKGYWVVSVGKAANGVVAYCFQLGYSGMYIPHVLVDLGVMKSDQTYNPSKTVNQVVPHYVGGSIGYNIIGKAVAKAPY